MAHVRPHKWADAAAGRVGESELFRMEAHAGECNRCAGERSRVQGALSVFSDIRETEAPPVHWEHVGARIYWVTSSERRSGRPQAPRWRRLVWPAIATAGLAAAAALLFGLYRGSTAGQNDGDSSRQAATQEAPTTSQDGTSPPSPTPVPNAVAVAPAAALSGLVTFLDGEVRHNQQAATFASVISPGDRLVAGEGQVAVQFGPHESFTLQAHSSLQVTAFDERRVELDIDGEVLVEVSKRRPGQTFVVRAGGKQVHVRGTRFSVALRDTGLRVACTEGEVAVLGGAREIAVPAGQMAQWAVGGGPSLRAMAPTEIAELERWLYRLPTWSDVPTLRRSTSVLRIGAAHGERAFLDGKPVGNGALAMRVMPGRHHVGVEGRAGSWVELGAGEHDAQVTAVAAPAPAVQPKAKNKPGTSARQRAKARAKRRAELNRALSRGARLDGCVRALRKQNLLENGHIELGIGVARSGAVSYLNIIGSNLPQDTARCVRDAVDNIAFGKGQAAEWQHRIEW